MPWPPPPQSSLNGYDCPPIRFDSLSLKSESESDFNWRRNSFFGGRGSFWQVSAKVSGAAWTAQAARCFVLDLVPDLAYFLQSRGKLHAGIIISVILILMAEENVCMVWHSSNKRLSRE
jgi:hypothetical protein